MNSTIALAAVAFLAVATAAPLAMARPSAPSVLCQVYPSANQCRGSIAPCTICHTAAPAFNVYGAALAGLLRRDQPFEVALPEALAQIEDEDTDADGNSNAQELADGTWPGNPSSFFQGSPEQPMHYSPEFAFRRMSAAFCGVSPTFDAIDALNAATDQRAFLHDELDACLRSTYWRQEALVHIADPLIRAVALLGHCGQAFLDFEPDYNLFIWAMTDGHNASDLLTAQYFVERSETDELTVVDKLPPTRTRAGVACTSILGGLIPQNVDRPYRAGMLTTANFLLNNTQGTYLPRVSAGIAYRSWIGADIAQYQALYSVPSEPRDIDKKGVKDPVCASCHATLDPLAYAYAYYYGAGGPKGFGAYGRDRPEVYLGGLGATREIMDDWYNAPPEPLPDDTSSLVRLAAEAAKSDLFARHVTRLIFREGVGSEPEPRDADEFDDLWRGLQASEFSIDSLCHRLIDTKAFGSPL
jgi:hypothetical protein